MKGFSLPDNK